MQAGARYCVWAIRDASYRKLQRRLTRTILIVDDSSEFRALARRIAQAAGLEVVAEAADGVEALSAAATTNPDVVLLDVRLPGLDGIAVAELLAVRRSPPAVVLTSSTDTRELRRAPRRRAGPRVHPEGAALRSRTRRPPGRGALHLVLARRRRRASTATADGATSGARRRQQLEPVRLERDRRPHLRRRRRRGRRPGRSRARPRTAARGSPARARSPPRTVARPPRGGRSSAVRRPARERVRAFRSTSRRSSRAARGGPRRAATRPSATPRRRAGTTRIAADWRPRRSPPSRLGGVERRQQSARQRARRGRECLEHRRPDRSEAMMFAWQETPGRR